MVELKPGKTRVLETREASGEIPAGTIIEICRKGYQRGNKIIRPADVITAKVKFAEPLSFAKDKFNE